MNSNSPVSDDDDEDVLALDNDNDTFREGRHTKLNLASSGFPRKMLRLCDQCL